MPHYTKEELELYRHGNMNVLGRIQCAAHLKNCPECRKLMQELHDDDAFVGELCESLRFYREASEAAPEPPRTSRRRRNRRSPSSHSTSR